MTAGLLLLIMSGEKRRAGRSKFKVGQQEVTLCVQSPGQFLPHYGHAVVTKQGVHCVDAVPQWRWRQVSLCDQHLKACFISRGFPVYIYMYICKSNNFIFKEADELQMCIVLPTTVQNFMCESFTFDRDRMCGCTEECRSRGIQSAHLPPVSTSCGRLALEGKWPLAEISVEMSRASSPVYCGHGCMSAD